MRKDALIYTIKAVVHRGEQSGYVAECPALPGGVSQGTTRSEALANIRDAMEGYLESLRAHGDPIPPGIHEEVIELAV